MKYMTAHNGPDVEEHEVEVLRDAPEVVSLKSRLFGTPSPDYVLIRFEDGFEMAVRKGDLYD